MLLELHAPAHLRVEDAVDLIASAVQGVWNAHPGLPPLDREALDRLRRVIGAWFGRTLDETRPGAGGGEVWVLRESAEAPDLLGINAAREIALNWNARFGKRDSLDRASRDFPRAINAALAGFRRAPAPARTAPARARDGIAAAVELA